MFLSIYGHAIVDTILDSPRAPDNEEFVGISGFHGRYGGTGANIAMGAARLGTPVSLHTFVGTDFPPEYGKRLEESGVDISGLVVKEGRSPRVWIVNTPAGQRGYVFQGVMGSMEDYEELIPPEDAVWVHFSTGRPGYYRPIAERLRATGKRTGFDPGQEIHYVYDRESLMSMLSLSDIFFCNESELDRALSILGLHDVHDLLDHVPMVINTLGPKGSVIVSDKGEEEVPAFPSDVADPTGAGDAYRAGFYTGLYMGTGYYEASILGSAVASIVIEGHGAQEPLPSLDDAMKRLKRGGYEVGT